MSKQNDKEYLHRYEMRLPKPQKELFEEAAKADGAMFRGKPSIATWLKKLAQTRIEELKSEGKL